MEQNAKTAIAKKIGLIGGLAVGQNNGFTVLQADAICIAANRF